MGLWAELMVIDKMHRLFREAASGHPAGAELKLGPGQSYWPSAKQLACHRLTQIGTDGDFDPDVLEPV